MSVLDVASQHSSGPGGHRQIGYRRIRAVQSTLRTPRPGSSRARLRDREDRRKRGCGEGERERDAEARRGGGTEREGGREGGRERERTRAREHAVSLYQVVWLDGSDFCGPGLRKVDRIP
eukprot:1669745-Rhodomonas_salina.2